MSWWRKKTAEATPASGEADCSADQAPALMSRYCAGDVPAFHALYDLLAPLVLADLAAHDAFGEEANALLEATFLALHRDRSAYVRGADPRPWLIALARREIQSARHANAARRPFGPPGRETASAPA
ncbi:MAG TPA: hypothetical protein VHO67_22410 [Polyangia bacterium]|nr:hypothetical protein [Polyangia bacterium]